MELVGAVLLTDDPSSAPSPLACATGKVAADHPLAYSGTIKFNAILSFLVWSFVACAYGASSAELKIQLGHSDAVNSVAISPDGKWALTGSDDRTARLWELSTGREIRRLEGHTEDILAVAFSPDGHTALTGSRDQTARLWDLATGSEILRLQAGTGQGIPGQVHAVAFSPDGRHALTGSTDHIARLWDLATGREILRLEGHESAVVAVAFSPDGRSALTGGWDVPDNAARLWDLTTGRETLRFHGHTGRVVSVAFSPDGRSALTGSDDATARLWDVATGHEIRRMVVYQRIDDHRDLIWSVAYSPDGRTALIGGSDNTAGLWDLATGQLIRRFEGHPRGVRAVAFSPDGRSALTGSFDHSARLWDVATGRVIRRLEGHTDAVFSAAFSADGKSILTGSADGRGRLWNLESGRQTGVFGSHSRPVSSVAFLADGRSAITGDWDGTVQHWDLATGQEIHRLSGEGIPVSSVAFVPKSGWVLAGSLDGNVRLWELASGRETGRWDVKIGSIHSVAVSPDGRWALIGSESQEAVLWDLSAGREVRRLAGHSGDVASVVFSPDGRTALTGSWDGTARWWDVAAGREMAHFSSNPESPANFAPIVGRAATLWEAAVGRMIQRGVGHAEDIHSVAFSPDGRYAVSGGEDHSVRLWELASGREVRRFVGHSDPVLAVAFSPDGRWVVSGSLDGTSKIWDAATGRLVVTVIGFRDGSWAVVDPEGRYDASDPDGSPGLYWQLGDEVIELRQLKHRFYTPNLLARALGFNSEPLESVAGLNDLQLWPAVELKEPAPGESAATLRLIDRGGGVGRVVVKVNGREMPLATRGAPIRTGTPMAVDLSAAELMPDGRNTIEVIAYGEANLVAGRGVMAPWQRIPTNAAALPTLHAVVAGVSSYAGDAMSLRFPAKDALDMAHALELGGKRMFGVGRIDIAVFASGTAHEPTKENIRKAFEAIPAKAGPSDVVLVYLAGHGIAGKAGSDLYYYLTRDARTVKPEDDAVLWEQTTVSSAELRAWLSRKGMPLNQVVVLDTCAAGAATGELTKLADRRELTADQRRAIELLKDANSGSHILMGAAADKVSYEASRYGQGLLTYSLLLGMRGEALDEGGRLDVEKWFLTAQLRVPEFARGIGGIQQPVIRSGGQTFPIAMFTPEDREQIQLATLKPQLLRAAVHDEDDNDPLRLDGPVRAELRAVSIPSTRGDTRPEPPLVYLDQVAGDVADAYVPQVRYQVTGSTVQIRLRLVSAQEKLERKFESPNGSPAELAKRITAEFIQMLATVKPK